MELKRTNSLSEMESFIGTLHPEQFICVVAERGFYYCYNETQLIRIHESCVYEGPARNYKSEL